eukprot:gene12115-2209_t
MAVRAALSGAALAPLGGPAADLLGCDSADPYCEDPNHQSNYLYSFQLGPDGVLSQPQRYPRDPLPGVPNWVHAAGQTLRQTVYTPVDTPAMGQVMAWNRQAGSHVLVNTSGTISGGGNPHLPVLPLRLPLSLPLPLPKPQPQPTYLFVANYEGNTSMPGDASLSVFRIEQPSGNIGEMTDHVVHTGHGPDPDRQASAHPHSIRWDRISNRRLFVGDLGLDKMFVYDFDQETGKLSPNSVNPTMGHLDISYQYDPASGALQEYQQISTLPDGYTGFNKASEIYFSGDHKFLFVGNRNTDNSNIAVFALDEDSKLTKVGNYPCGRYPRSFLVDWPLRRLIVGAQGSWSVEVFNINQDGSLKLQHNNTGIPTPSSFAMPLGPVDV